MVAIGFTNTSTHSSTSCPFTCSQTSPNILIMCIQNTTSLNYIPHFSSSTTSLASQKGKVVVKL